MRLTNRRWSPTLINDKSDFLHTGVANAIQYFSDQSIPYPSVGTDVDFFLHAFGKTLANLPGKFFSWPNQIIAEENFSITHDRDHKGVPTICAPHLSRAFDFRKIGSDTVMEWIFRHHYQQHCEGQHNHHTCKCGDIDSCNPFQRVGTCSEHRWLFRHQIYED